ncbi:MAG: presqualene diphosphate synthase HpnD [Alphaproteobacteria bacterium]|nr:presqualene diphosphate synthase HpnD [Alphaproteobacteria bacterium]
MKNSENYRSLSAKEEKECMSYVTDVVQRSGSSFYWAMKILPKHKRDAMFVVYAFCREVDDVADEPAPLEEKQQGLHNWRTEIENVYGGKPKHPVGKALINVVEEFGLEKDELLAVIDGMEMDIPNGMCAPSIEELRLYCRRVAGAVGMLSIKIFGDDSEAARGFAVSLGEALQITNILRDMKEDAEIGRLYMPAELLQNVKIKTIEPIEVINHTQIGRAREELSKLANLRFVEAANFLAKTDKKAMKPAIIMMKGYRSIYDVMKKRGWDKLEPRPSVNKFKMLWAVLFG